MSIRTDQTTVIHNLEAAFQAISDGHSSPSSFEAALAAINWSEQPPVAFKRAIDLLLNLEAIRHARQMANEGHELYPDDKELAAAARVLAPPRILSTSVPPKPSLGPTMQWLNENAQHYRGLWVAVKNGELMGQAETRKLLVASLGDTLPSIDIITRIP